MKQLQNEFPVNGFPLVTLPCADMPGHTTSYISFELRYIEQSLSGTFFSQSFVRFSPENKQEFVARLKLLSEAANEKQTIAFAFKRTYERMKRAEELCSILEANMTDEDYERVYEEYEDELMQPTRQARRINPEDTAKKAKILLKTLDCPLGSDDIADMLDLGVLEVERVLQTHKKNQQ